MLIIGEENPTEALEDLVLRGYCFHGSSRKIEDRLLPSLASDESKESGNRKAVYMTVNPLLAEFTALAGGREVGKRKNICHVKIEDGKITYPEEIFFGVEKREELAEEGYIYVLDSKTSGFEEVNGEILAYEPVEPLFAIKIKIRDFKYPINKIV